MRSARRAYAQGSISYNAYQHGLATLAFDTIAHIDEIRTTDSHEPGATYYHLVCAHAFANGREVFSEWQMTATDANGWIPATSGNCLELVPPATGVAHVTFVAADATTARLDVAE